MRSINAMNNRMPFCWRGVALWPDGLDAIFTDGIASGDQTWARSPPRRMVNNIVDTWTLERTGGTGEAPPAVSGREVVQQRRYLQNGGSGASLRLYYTLNPLLPCRRGHDAPSDWIISIPDLMRFLEKSAGAVTGNMIDPHLAAFIAARSDIGIESAGQHAAGPQRTPDAYRLGEIRLLRGLAVAATTPSRCRAWASGSSLGLRPELEQWRNRTQARGYHGEAGSAGAGFLDRCRKSWI